MNQGGHMTTGTWNIGGFNLPDFGITERFAPQTTQPSTFYNPAAAGTGQMGPAVNATNFSSTSPQTSFGDILGVSTSGSGSSGGGFAPQGIQSPQAPGSSPQDQTTQMQNAIGGAWDAYTNQLNDMLNQGLPGQMQGQQQQAQGAYDQALNQSATQQTASTNQLNQQKASSLKDLGSNIKNLFQSGNIYLGARGAGDSSAANQYSYALTKMGSKSRGDIQTQASQRIQQIGDIYNSEKNNLQAGLQQQLGQIAQWFNQAQNTLRQQIGQAGVSKATDINALSQNMLNQAIQAKQQIEAQAAQQYNALSTWAMNNSKDVQSLIINMQAAQQSFPGFQGINSPFGNMNQQTANTITPVGNATDTTKKKNIFG